MPGHVKLGAKGEPDPDPTPYLVVSLEMKREDQHKPYDPRKSVWCPYEKDGGFIEGLLQSEEGGKSTVLIGHEVRMTDSVRCSGHAVSIDPRVTIRGHP